PPAATPRSAPRARWWRRAPRRRRRAASSRCASREGSSPARTPCCSRWPSGTIGSIPRSRRPSTGLTRAPERRQSIPGSMDTLLIHALNALLYASVMFLIAGGLSLIYGVLRIVTLPHGTLYAFGAYVAAWAAGLAIAGMPAGWGYLVLGAGPVGGAALGAALARATLAARGEIPAPPHLRAAPDPRGPHAPGVGAVPALGERALRGAGEPSHRRGDLSRLQPRGDRGGRPRRRRALGLPLPHAR